MEREEGGWEEGSLELGRDGKWWVLGWFGRHFWVDVGWMFEIVGVTLLLFEFVLLVRYSLLFDIFFNPNFSFLISKFHYPSITPSERN